MNHFLVVFDRAHGRLLSVKPCSSPNAAMKARFKAERQYRDNKDIEIVVLGARSAEALRSTHARYFSNFRDLAERGQGLLKEQANLATTVA